MAKTRTGTPIVLTNIHGRQDCYLLLAGDGNIAIARDGHGNFQGLRKDALGRWKCVKVPQRTEGQAWRFAREG